jgi:hypothetical protein
MAMKFALGFMPALHSNRVKASSAAAPALNKHIEHMPTLTCRLPMLLTREAIATSQVLFMKNRFQVVRIRTRSVAAQVVDLVSFRYRAFVSLVRQAVRACYLLFCGAKQSGITPLVGASEPSVAVVSWLGKGVFGKPLCVSIGHLDTIRCNYG